MTTAPLVDSKPAKPKPVNLLKAPPIAWPTILLHAMAWSAWLGVLVTALTGALNPWIALVVNTVLGFVLFTPMHDASHKSLTRAKIPNEIMGRMAALGIHAPFPAFRYLHLQHHKHTNHDHEDPDMWAGRGPWFVLPLRWLTQDLHYYAFYFSRWAERPKAERRETALTLALTVVGMGALMWLTSPLIVLLAWLIPARLAVAALSYSFDYLPHKPHHTTSKQDRYTATSVRPTPWLSPILLYQNYHLVHHLYPGVPFYRYAMVWRDKEATLRKRGAKVIE